MIRSLFKRSGVYLAGLTLAKILSVSVFILFARVLGPAEFGNLLLYATFGQIITFLGDFGLTQWYQKKAHDNDKYLLFSKLIRVRIFTLAVSLILGGVFFYLIPTFSREIVILFLITMIPDAFGSVIDGYYLFEKKSLLVSLKLITKFLIYFIGYFVFTSSLTFERSTQIYLTASIAALVLFFPWKMLKSFGNFKLGELRETMKSSFPYAFLNLASFAYARGDSIVIKYALNSAALGVYGAAYRFLEGVALIPTALSHNLFAETAKEKNVSAAALIKITTIMTVIGIVAASIMYLGAEYFVLLFLGQSYLQSVILLKIFSAVVVLFFISASLNTAVLSSKLVKGFLPYGFANTILNVVLNIVLVPIYGLVAAAWVMFATELSGLIINLYFARKLYR